jgi:prepilin-type N-terminal cleavage/methylation domain-containing protein
MHRAIQRGRSRFGGQGGFTLFEVIMVLLILGIISYFASTRLFTDDGISRVAEMDLVKNHLRYAQSRAMNSESSWGIKFVSPKQYWLFMGENPDMGKQRLPNVEDFIERIPGAPRDGSMTLSANTVPNAVVKFDPFGSPGASTITLNLSPAGPITITKNTGFIP